MSQDPRIMAAAWRKFSAEREARRAALAQLTREVHRRLPRVESIDRELRRRVGGSRRAWPSSGSGRSCW